MYEGPELPPEEVAEFTVMYSESTFAWQRWRAVFVDGEDVGSVPLVMYLKPGPHEIYAMKHPGAGYFSGVLVRLFTDQYCARLNVVVEAGQTYQFEDPLDYETLLIIDSSGQEVARAALEDRLGRAWLARELGPQSGAAGVVS